MFLFPLQVCLGSSVLTLGLAWPSSAMAMVLPSLVMAIIDQAGRAAFAMLAMLVPRGPRSVPGPGLGW